MLSGVPVGPKDPGRSERSQDWVSLYHHAIFTTQKIKFSITDFFSKCDQICRKLWIWLHLTKKPVMENLIFCTVFNETHVPHMIREISTEKWWLENMSNLKLLFFVKFLFFIKKLWEMFFILSKKLFLFSRHSNFSNFFSSFPNFPD